MSENGRRKLSRAGLRVTNQRVLLLEIIRQGKGHLDAYDIHRRARKRIPRLSLSTVYRALQKFKEMELVEEVHFDEAHHHYEAKKLSEHYHMVCLGCGRVIEFSYPLVSRIKSEVPEAGDFDITDTRLQLSGYCPRCRRNQTVA